MSTKETTDRLDRPRHDKYCRVQPERGRAVVDIVRAELGDPCPTCGQPLDVLGLHHCSRCSASPLPHGPKLWSKKSKRFVPGANAEAGSMAWRTREAKMMAGEADE